MIVPDLLANAPMFKRVGPNAMRGRGIGAARGRATIQRGEYTIRGISDWCRGSCTNLNLSSQREKRNDEDKPGCSTIKCVTEYGPSNCHLARGRSCACTSHGRGLDVLGILTEKLICCPLTHAHSDTSTARQTDLERMPPSS